MKAIFRIAESSIDALFTVDLGPKRPFSVGECALWARLARRWDAEETPGRPVFCVGARKELKTRGGSLSSEGTNAAVQA